MDVSQPIARERDLVHILFGQRNQHGHAAALERLQVDVDGVDNARQRCACQLAGHQPGKSARTARHRNKGFGSQNRIGQCQVGQYSALAQARGLLRRCGCRHRERLHRFSLHGLLNGDLRHQHRTAAAAHKLLACWRIRRGKKGFGRVRFLHRSASQQQHPVSHGCGMALVVGDEQDGPLLPYAFEQFQQQVGVVLVQIGCGLIYHQQIRVCGYLAQNGDGALLYGWQLHGGDGQLGFQLRKPHAIQKIIAPLAALLHRLRARAPKLGE
ncbi:hypothetical protein D3C72_1266740 [compost metagenome]